MRLREKTILIVGAGSGLGKELVEQLLQRGCRVIGFSRRVEEVWSGHPLAGRTEAQAGGPPGNLGAGRLLLLKGDVRHPADVTRLFDTIRSSGLPLDGVFYSTGVSRPDHVENPDVERSIDTLRTNLEGAFRTFYAALPFLQVRPEAFLAGFSSMAADRGMPRAHAYCASKAGLDRLLEGLRIDLWETNVKVFTIVPGYVETPMSAQNQFPMPGIWPVVRGVSHLLREMERGRLLIRFPWYHSWGMRLLGLLPDRLYWWLMSRNRPQVRISPQPTDEFRWPVDI